MRKNLMPRAVVLAAVATFAATGVFAQDEEPLPGLTPPPDTFGPELQTAVITSDLDDPERNERIRSAALAAHRDLGGRNARFRPLVLPLPENVDIAVRDLADPEGGLVHDVVVASGGDKQATVGAAGINGNSLFVDLDQSVPCITEGGRPDPSGTCAGGIEGLPFNYSAVTFASDEAAYLAGIVAAGAARNGGLGIISGLPDCEDCNRIIEGFTLGARSVRPSIGVEVAYLSDGDEQAAYGDASTARAFTEAFINVFGPDVLVPIAGASSRGIIEAACDAGVLVVGTEVDVSVAYPNLSQCVLTSIVKDWDAAVRESVFSLTREDGLRQRVMDLRNGGVELRAGDAAWAALPGLPVDLTTRVDRARQDIEAGLLETCPTMCRTIDDQEPGEAGASPTAEAATSPAPDA